MLADDSPVVAAMVAELLAEAGAEIVGTAFDGLEALSLWRAQRPDLAVLDFQMPGLNGLEVIRSIRSEERQQPTRAPCFLVILSSHTEPSFAEQCLAAGADHFLNKQSDYERLPVVVTLVAEQRPGPL